MRYFRFQETSDLGILQEAKVEDGSVKEWVDVLKVPKTSSSSGSGGDSNADLSDLSAKLAELLAWKNEQESSNDNGSIDTMKEVRNLLAGLSEDDNLKEQLEEAAAEASEIETMGAETARQMVNDIIANAG